MEAEAKQIVDAQEQAEFYQWKADEHWDYRETFPRILFNSFHIAAYAMLESGLVAVSKRVGKKHKQIFDVSDFGGRDYLKSAASYIKKVAGVDILQFASWQQIDDGRTLRNNIVHSNGVLTKPHELEVAKKYGLLSRIYLDENSGRSIDNLSITYDYNKLYISAMVDFFRELYTTAREHI